MKPDYRNALVLSFEGGVCGSSPAKDIRFINAVVLPGLPPSWRDVLTCEQQNRSTFLDLQKAGYQLVAPGEITEAASTAVFVPGRSRRWNEYKLAMAWNVLPNGGRMVFAGDKNNGAGAIRKWFGEHAPIADSFSKHHAFIFWADKTDDTELPVVAIEKSVGSYVFSDGMFSSAGPDKGSILLAQHFGDHIKGKVSDMGAGWGYLSAELLKRSGTVTKLDLFEADHVALEAARVNLSGHKATTTFNWIDVTAEFEKRPYDWVIMNPPFHSGRSAEPDLGKRFVEVAASTLPSGGKLLMVANQNLPYEKTLERQFRTFEKLEERGGFKVIRAVK
ncbi:MAG: class I SAM-dependent methyltransferase [Pseudomonadota bacterium]